MVSRLTQDHRGGLRRKQAKEARAISYCPEGKRMHEANEKGSGCYRPDGSRRRFLQKATAGTVAAPFIARATIWRLSRAEAQEVRVRRNVYDLASNGPEIAALRNGVKV